MKALLSLAFLSLLLVAAPAQTPALLPDDPDCAGLEQAIEPERLVRQIEATVERRSRKKES